MRSRSRVLWAPAAAQKHLTRAQLLRHTLGDGARRQFQQGALHILGPRRAREELRVAAPRG